MGGQFFGNPVITKGFRPLCFKNNMDRMSVFLAADNESDMYRPLSQKKTQFFEKLGFVASVDELKPTRSEVVRRQTMATVLTKGDSSFCAS